MKIDDLYQEIILDHYRTKHHSGLREPYQVEVHHVNPTCGDEVTLRLQLEGDVIADVSYEAVGCSISQASTSVMTDLVIGRTVGEGLDRHEEFLALMQGQGNVEPDEERLEDAVAFAGVARFPVRVKCALLGWSAFKDAAIQAAAPEVRTGNGQRPGDEGI
jgi:nitrogen fixation NifU-like protein